MKGGAAKESVTDTDTVSVTDTAAVSGTDTVTDTAASEVYSGVRSADI